MTRGTFRKRLHDARQALATIAATGAVILESDHYGGVRVLEQRRGHAATLEGDTLDAVRPVIIEQVSFHPLLPYLHNR